MKKLIFSAAFLAIGSTCFADITAYGDKSSSSQTTTASTNGTTTTSTWSVNCTGDMSVVCAVIKTGRSSFEPQIGEVVQLSIYDKGVLVKEQSGALKELSAAKQNMHVVLENNK
jgi:invasion protein IalB